MSTAAGRFKDNLLRVLGRRAPVRGAPPGERDRMLIGAAAPSGRTAVSLTENGFEL
jgi:hypothetical protein